MADDYTTRGGLIQPEPGQSLDTWGAKLNDNNFAMADKGLFGFQAIVVTGDFSLTSANGDSTSTQLNKAIYLGGTPTADFTVTFLSKEQTIIFYNDTGKNATIKVLAGTGVTLADGQIALLGYNSTLGDVTNVSPNRIAGDVVIGGALQVGGKVTNMSPATNGTDAVNLTQFNNALAAILTAGDGSLLVQATDSTRKFLASALLAAATSGIVLTVSGGSGANQTLNAALYFQGLAALVGNVDYANDRVALYDTSSGTHVYVPPSQIASEGDLALFADAMG